MTLEELAESSGVSRAMISKVERGEKSPTISVAVRMAAGLGVSVGRLLGEEREHRGIVLRREHQMVLRDPESGFERRLLSGAGKLEFLRNLLPEGASTGEFPAHRVGTTEYVAVERGRLQASLGDEEYVLEAGDSLAFEADVEHGFENAGVGEAVYYLVIL